MFRLVNTVRSAVVTSCPLPGVTTREEAERRLKENEFAMALEARADYLEAAIKVGAELSEFESTYTIVEEN